MTAEGPASDMGWIVPGDPCRPGDARARAIERFIEKPPEQQAKELLRMGGQWNSLIVAGSAVNLWKLADRHLPVVTHLFQPYLSLLAGNEASQNSSNAPRHLPRRTRAATFLLREIYARLPAADLSRDILERARGAAVVEMPNAGWSDCGTPERLFRRLGDAAAISRFLERLGPAGVIARSESLGATF